MWVRLVSNGSSCCCRGFVMLLGLRVSMHDHHNAAKKEEGKCIYMAGVRHAILLRFKGLGLVYPLLRLFHFYCFAVCLCVSFQGVESLL